MSAPDPAVRSIRIATTLNERFRDLIHQRTAADNVAELELRIGEAQQIYPEIWNHLDDARTVISGRGGDTSGYDAIKAAQGAVRLGVTRVEVEDHHSFGLGGYDHVQTKDAFFNIEGFRSAHKACAALMAAMSEVDWKAVERAENLELAAAGSLGPVSGKKALRWIVIAAALLGITYAFWFFVVRIEPMSAEEREAQSQKWRTERIAEYRPLADAEPCNKHAVEDLARELGYEQPPGQGKAARALYRERCEQLKAELTRTLEADPCDVPTVNKLTRAIQWSSYRVAQTAAVMYRDRCAGSKAAPVDPP